MATVTPETKFSLSLMQLVSGVVFIISATFAGGLAYSAISKSSQDLTKTQGDVVEIKGAINKISTAIELMQQQQQYLNSDVKRTSETIGKINSELVIVNSHITEIERKKGR